MDSCRLKFSVGATPLPSLRMIERHYFQVWLLRPTHFRAQRPEAVRFVAELESVQAFSAAAQNEFVREFDTSCGFCIPHSQNTWDTVRGPPGPQRALLPALRCRRRLARRRRCAIRRPSGWEQANVLPAGRGPRP